MVTRSANAGGAARAAINKRLMHSPIRRPRESVIRVLVEHRPAVHVIHTRSPSAVRVLASSRLSIVEGRASSVPVHTLLVGMAHSKHRHLVETTPSDLEADGKPRG